MNSFSSQLRQVLRRLGRAPMFTAITLITLAAGIGANAVVFGVIEGVLLKPLPYPKAEELAGIWLTAPGINIKKLNLSPADYFIYREQNQTFQDIGVYNTDSDTITGVGEPEQVPVLNVTDGMLPLLGIRPFLGRLISRKDDSPDSPETAMITYGYWQRKFGGSPSVLGKTILVDGKQREIIGVVPEDFHFLDERDPALILPFQFDRNKQHLGNYSFNGIARLKPGAALAQASADVARMLPMVFPEFSAAAGVQRKAFRASGNCAKPAAAETGRGRRYRQSIVGPDGLDRNGAADCLCECGESASGEGRRAAAGTGDSFGARGGARAHRWRAAV